MPRNCIIPPRVMGEQVMDMTGTWPLQRGGDPQYWSMETLQLAGGDMSPSFQRGWGRSTYESAHRGQTPRATQEQ